MGSEMCIRDSPSVDNIAQAVLFESQAKFDRMQAFLDRKKENKDENPE